MSSFFWLMIGGAFVSCLVVLLLIGRRNERLVRRDWEMLLTPRGEKVYGAIEGKVRTELGMADLSFEHALVYRELGTTEEAIRLLDVGYRVIEKFSPDMLRLLAAMATFALEVCKALTASAALNLRLPVTATAMTLRLRGTAATLLDCNTLAAAAFDEDGSGRGINPAHDNLSANSGAPRSTMRETNACSRVMLFSPASAVPAA